MVREIVHVQVGQCGNQIGCAFWKEVQLEHRLDPNGKFMRTQPNGKRWPREPGVKKNRELGYFHNIPDQLRHVEVYYRCTSENSMQKDAKFVPRSVLVDLEPGTMDAVKNDAILGNLFRDDNMTFGQNGAGNNWAKGHYTEGAELVEEVMDRIRSELEACEAPQGFQLFHSLGGGTGSGMGTLLLVKIRDSYPDRITSTYSIYPSPKVSDTVVEPYNAILSSKQLLENADEVFIVDNEALYNINTTTLKLKNPQYEHLNRLVALATCGITASLRFPGKLNGDLRKLGVNLVPFPRLHFFLISYAPIVSQQNRKHTKLAVHDLCSACYSPSNYFVVVKPKDGVFLAASFIFRGNINTKEVDSQMQKLQLKNTDSFVEWIPNNLKSSIVSTPPVVLEDPTVDDPSMYVFLEKQRSATFVANTTALKGIFQRLSTQFMTMYRRRAFLHWYKGEGMDELEFEEADRSVRDLITEYQDKEDAVYEPEADYDSDEASYSEEII